MATTLVFTACYNEVENINSLIHDIRSNAPAVDVLVIDDNSPDGTGALLDTLAESRPWLTVIHRPRKAGLGSAHMLAMRHAIKHNYKYLVTMDADYSHHPRYLPELIGHLDSGSEFVIGSRYTTGGACDYGILRQILSRGANTLAISLLGLRLKETTTSYRGFSITMLRRLNLDAIRSTGYSFFVEFVYAISSCSNSLTEFPIHFEDRRAGASKISKVEIIKGVLTLFRLAGERISGKKANYTRATEMRIADTGDAFHCPACHFEEFAVIDAPIVRCLGCGLIQLPATLVHQVTPEEYDQTHAPIPIENFSARLKSYASNLDSITSYVPLASTRRMLHIGAESGTFLEAAQDRGFTVTGTEISRRATQHCRERKGLNVYCGKVHNLPSDESNFQLVTSWGSLEHAEDPVAELNEIYNRLIPDGILALTTLKIDNWFLRLLNRYRPWYKDTPRFYYSDDVLAFLLKESGFSVEARRPWQRVLTAEQICYKLADRGIPLARKIGTTWSARLSRIHVPVPFGRMQMTIARKQQQAATRSRSSAVSN